MSKQKITLVIPCFNEQESLPIFYKEISKVLHSMECDYELIFIDDGSNDDTLKLLRKFGENDKNLKYVSFSRNFGKESALCAGLDAATGDCAICLDSDMQFPPEVIPDMYKLWEEGYEVVEGVKKKRQKESLMYKLCAGTFYSFLKKSSNIDLRNSSDFRLLDRAAIDAWKEMPEKQTFFRGMSSWVGFKRYQYEFEVADRIEGESKWSFKRLIGLAVDAVTSYTAAPLYAASIFGIIFFVFAVVMGIQTLYMYVLGKAQSGFTTVILLLLFIGAVILLGLGVIGIYIKKIYEEVKGRPRYIISRVIGKKDINK